MKRLLMFLFVLFTLAGWSQEPVNEELVESIRKHGLDKSEVMNIAEMITDVYRPRLTGFPMLGKATD